MDGFAALFQLAAWIAVTAILAVASPPIIAAYTAIRGDCPFWRTFWRRYLKTLWCAVEAIG